MKFTKDYPNYENIIVVLSMWGHHRRRLRYHHEYHHQDWKAPREIPVDKQSVLRSLDEYMFFSSYFDCINFFLGYRRTIILILSFQNLTAIDKVDTLRQVFQVSRLTTNKLASHVVDVSRVRDIHCINDLDTRCISFIKP